MRAGNFLDALYDGNHIADGESCPSQRAVVIQPFLGGLRLQHWFEVSKCIFLYETDSIDRNVLFQSGLVWYVILWENSKRDSNRYQTAKK
jgi:hypothetical protein